MSFRSLSLYCELVRTASSSLSTLGVMVIGFKLSVKPSSFSSSPVHRELPCMLRMCCVFLAPRTQSTHVLAGREDGEWVKEENVVALRRGVVTSA